MGTTSQTSATVQQELDIRAYLSPIWRHKLVVLAVLILGAALGYFLAHSEQNKYTASTDLYIQFASPTLSSSSVSIGSPNAPTTAQLGDIASLITSSSVEAAVRQELGAPVSSLGTVTATPSTSSDFVTITAQSPSAAMAANLANAFAKQFLASRRRSLLLQARAALTAARKTLKTVPSGTGNFSSLAVQIQSLQQTLLNPETGTSQAVRASVPTTPTSPKPKEDAIFGAAIGLLLGIVAAFGLEALDVRLRSVEDLESAFGRPALAVLPKVSDPTPMDASVPTVPLAFVESLRMLRFQLRLNPDAGEPQIILIMSGVSNEGKSTTTRDLALVYATSGQKVLVIDTDLRNPSLGRLFGVRPSRGLTEVLVHEAEFQDCVEAVTLPEGGSGSLDVLMRGMHISDGVNLLASRSMREFLDEAKRAYDVVLLDTAPLLMVADSTPLLPLADCVLIVARFGIVNRRNANSLISIIERLGDVKFAGLIANGYSVSSRGYDYGYGYYGTEESKPKGNDRTPSSATTSNAGEPPGSTQVDGPSEASTVSTD